MKELAMPENTIGLIVRGKNNDSHSPGVMAQHADCVLSTGEPIGFFGDNGDGSSGGSSGSLSQGGLSASWNKSGLNMKGTVANYSDMLKIRPYYVDINLAKKYQVISTMLLISVTHEQKILFDQAWKNIKLSPGSFNLLGGNCSTHASIAFVEANIVNRGIPGLDTPNNLYKQLKSKMKDKCKVYNGHIGFNSKSLKKYSILIDTPTTPMR